MASAEEIGIQGCGAATTSYFSPHQEPLEEATGDILLIKQSTPAAALIVLARRARRCGDGRGFLDNASQGGGRELIVSAFEKQI